MTSWDPSMRSTFQLSEFPIKYSQHTYAKCLLGFGDQSVMRLFQGFDGIGLEAIAKRMEGRKALSLTRWRQCVLYTYLSKIVDIVNYIIYWN